ncbi:hypothetical protein PFDG_02933 [Plasmodium falciparum Dd2]|uniref:Methyltransferase type 11 domain-containing protein n=1 Tax=Plasmodium falciparum (isolate Dd2) TaxID=57267 RepID=A0A0L7M3F9_PLAF4|nr:hypothetical protein PFDG_02933 [Plasmodium falciparum Dd2]
MMFLERITKIFNNRQPNQITILNCHLKKAIEYVIESSYIFDEEIAFLVLGNELPILWIEKIATSSYSDSLERYICGPTIWSRYKSCKDVENIINEEKEGNIILDVGCGNGKNLSESSKYFYIGLDFSLYLLMLARKKMNTDLLLANCINIPLRSNLADLCISIAVIHHLGTHEKRKQAVKEMVRCTKIGGRILIYVWAYEQQENVVGNRKFDSQDIFVPWYFQQQYKTEGYDDDAEGEGEEEPEKENEKEKEESHKFKPVKKDLVKLERYYHVFKKEELYELCNSIEEVKVEKFYFDCNNWGIILRKIF